MYKNENLSIIKSSKSKKGKRVMLDTCFNTCNHIFAYIRNIKIVSIAWNISEQ